MNASMKKSVGTKFGTGFKLRAAAAAAVTLTMAGGAAAGPVKPKKEAGVVPPIIPVMPVIPVVPHTPVTPTHTELDLSGANPLGSVTANGVTFQRTGVQPTGTGVIDPFVRLQSPGNDKTEHGYNTGVRKLQLDENNSPNFTRSLALADLGAVSLGGTSYYQFLLDVNEPNGGKSLLSLDEFELYQSDEANLFGYDAATKFGPGASLVFDLDTGADRYLKIDADLMSGGSGSGDVYAYVPTSFFDADLDYVTLYTRFGDHYGAEGGFEEWAARGGTGPAAIPLPPAAWSGLATLGMLGTGLAVRRLRKPAVA